MRFKVLPSLLTALMALVGLFSLLSCTAQYALNPKLEVKLRENPFRSKLVSSGKSDELFLILAFSGGGTRAASLSYGVLEALDRIEVPDPKGSQGADHKPGKRTLLDEVDLISGVSGGSFTAAYYGLHGRDAFKDYREKVLLQDLQGGLLWGLITPVNWFRLWSPRFGRSDMAQEFYDYMIFHGATLGDLASGKGPAVVILATDAIDGIVFPFMPSQFALICSDFEKFPLARAVAASAAFPGPMTPIILKNYAGQCDHKVPPWINDALAKSDPTSRVYYNAVMTKTYLEPETKPYIHLIDGGVSDNLGIRGIMDTIAAQGGMQDALKQGELAKTRRVVFIIVDAQTQERPRWRLLDEIPGLGAMLGASSTIMINKYNFETIDLLRRYAGEWTYEDEAAGREPIEIYVIHVAFASLPDKAEREYFQEIPTALTLPAEQVDKLREVAGKLLYAQEPFKKLVTDLGGKMPETVPPK
ncbi:MAG: patatin-like phospholipase family protein [Deltaproteobacteria bacterium]|nr:patatin-like phospholipase family protein [Deltaproteobacteria bacterium]